MAIFTVSDVYIVAGSLTAAALALSLWWLTLSAMGQWRGLCSPPSTLGITLGWRREIMDFGSALEALKSGMRVTRRGWNGKGMWLALQTPDAGSKMTLPYIYMSTAQGGLVPWLASQTDILAIDWEVV